MKLLIIAQIIGVFGMVMNVVSYQAKTQKNILFIQFFGSLFFAINLFMLQAYTGALLNLVGVFRALIYANKEKIKNLKTVNFVFYAIYILSYILTFALFGKEVSLYNLIVEILPVIAMIAATISFTKKTAASIRKFAFISSPAWLIYNCFNFAIGGILCELFVLTSVIIAIFRLDKKGDCSENPNS